LDEIRLDGEWVDLISSEAKPKISSALADFILASAYLQRNSPVLLDAVRNGS